MKKLTGNVYKITNSVDNKIYVGSCGKYPSTRWGVHLADYERKKDGASLLYKHMRLHGPDKFKMEILEQVEHYKDDDILLLCEKKWYLELKPELNLKSPYQTVEEFKAYYKTPEMTQKRKEYYDANKSKLLERQLEVIVCEFCDAEVSRTNMIKHQKRSICLDNRN
jgi:hypothetical protein